MAETMLTDEFSTLYGALRDQFDGARWRTTVRDARRPSVVQSMDDVRTLIADIAPQYQVDPRLVEAVMGMESGGTYQALSKKGAQGLMQLMPGTAKRFGVTDPYDPVQNITGGVKYLAHLQQLFPGRVDLQLAGYHAGEGAVLNAGRAIPGTHDGNMTTQAYVQAVLSRYQPGTPYTSRTAGAGGLPPVVPVEDVRSALTAPTAENSALFADVQAAMSAPTGAPEPGRQSPSQQQLQADAQMALSAPTVPSVSPFPSVGAVEQKLAEPETLRYEPEQRTMETTGRERAYQPFTPQEGVEEAEPTRTIGNIVTGALQSVQNTMQGIAALPQAIQGANQPGVLSGLATVAQDVAQILAPLVRATKPTLMEQPTLWDKAATALGSSIPFYALGTIAGGGWAGAGAAAVTEAAGEAGDLYSKLSPVVGEQEAAQRALKSFGLNVLLVGLTDRLGIFSDTTSPLRRALAGVVTNGVQEAAQYDIDRRQIWVPADHASAATLLAQGWQQEGDRIVQPFTPADAGEAALIGMLIGGPVAAGVGAVFQHAQTAEQGPLTRLAESVLNLLPEPSTAPTPTRGILGSETGAISIQPSLRLGAEGLSPERYKDASGRWKVPLRDMPAEELELQDFIRQQGGVNLTDEELQGEFTALLSRKETGMGGLQNNASGLTAQQMAEQAQERGFIPTADKQSLLDALDRSVTQGQAVFSLYATGRVPLLDDPQVQSGYQAVLDAIDAMTPRTEEQVGGVRHRQDVHEEARQLIEAGLWTLDDVRELFPNTTLNDTQASALLQSLNTLGTQLTTAAQAYLDSGAQVGSAQEQSLQQVMGLFAEMDPYRLGVSAAQSRGLGILNDPLSRYTQFLNNLHQVLANAPERTMQQIATRIVAAQPAEPKTKEYWAAHPEELQTLFDAMRDLQPTPFRLEADEAELLLGTRTAAEQALIDAAYRAEPVARTPAEWNAVFRDRAQQRLLAEWQAGAFERERAVADLAEDNAQRDRQREEAYQRAREDWSAADQARDADYQAAQVVWEQQARERFAQRWHASMRSHQELFETTERLLREAKPLRGVPLTDLDAADLARLDQALHPWQAQSTQPALLQAMVQTAKPGFAQYFLELWFNAILSNPSTHIANAIGNTLTTAWAMPERFIAEQFGRASTQGVARGEANAMLYGLVHGIQDAWAVAVRSWQAGQPVSGVGREFVRDPVVTASHANLDPASPLGRVVDFWGNYIGLASGGRLPSRALMAADEFFKMLNYRMELNALAYREAVRLGYEGTAFAEHVARVVSRPQLHHLQEAAQTFAITQTFQRELPPGSLGATLQQASALQFPVPWTDVTFPIGKVIIPFVQTPANIARYATERTPLGFFYRSMQEDLAAGGARADLASAKMTLGTMVMVAAGAYVLSGKLVGRGPEDKELREIWLQAHPEYSVYVPLLDKWVAYDRLEPVGMLLGMTADLVQIVGEADAAPYQRALVAPLYAFMRNIGSKTYMDGLNRFFEAMAPRVGGKAQHYEERVFRFMSRTGSGLLQPSALLAATARVFDPAEKEALDLVDALYARMPGWRDDVPSRRSLGGEKLIRGWGFEPELLANTLRAYWPLKLGDGTMTRADAEILANKMSISLPPRSLATRALQPGEMAQATEVDISTYRTLRLTPAQYERYTVLAAGNQVEAQKLGLTLPDKAIRDVVDNLATGYSTPPPSRLLSLGEALDWMSTTREYREAENGPGGGKEDHFKDVVQAYRRMGRELLLAHDATLRQQYTETQAQHRALQYPVRERPALLHQEREGAARDQQLRLEGLGIR